MTMGDDAPLPTSNANTAPDLNGDLDNMDPFKPKKALANSPPTERKNTANVLTDNTEQTENVPTETVNDENKNEVPAEKPNKAHAK